MAAEANYVRVDIQRLGALGGASVGSGSGSGSGSGGGRGAAAEPQQQQEQAGEHAAAAGAPPPPPRRQLLCTVRGLLKKVRQRVLVGDVVAVTSVDWAAGRGVVEAVSPRVTELVDPAVANVDHVVLLFGLTQPPFEPQQVSRFLVSIEAAGLPLTLALNKADLVPEAEVEARVAQCAAWGYTAVAVSCASGRGLEALGAALAGRTAVVAGPSGAGKSSLINALRLGRHREDEGGLSAEEAYGGGWAAEGGGFLAVGDMSKIGRGKHTTRVVRLIPLPGGGLVADTPGFGLPTLDGVGSVELAGLFPEFGAARAGAPGGGCRFDDCMHVAEPGCAVSGAGLERYPHYLKFLAEVKVREDYDVRVMQAAKRQREGAVKVKTGRGGEARLEARLESKRHRVTSRRSAKQTLLRRAVADDGGGDSGGDEEGGGGPGR
ncbi:MAG: hypothetical protein J3K34DRAFT_384159 [Monoraphidium minutum]|nr:MAG: hypothetical protein J3K34DRAFT_384159 [Monoraphidium minutum]